MNATNYLYTGWAETQDAHISCRVLVSGSQQRNRVGQKQEAKRLWFSRPSQDFTRAQSRTLSPNAGSAEMKWYILQCLTGLSRFAQAAALQIFSYGASVYTAAEVTKPLIERAVIPDDRPSWCVVNQCKLSTSVRSCYFPSLAASLAGVRNSVCLVYQGGVVGWLLLK